MKKMIDKYLAKLALEVGKLILGDIDNKFTDIQTKLDSYEARLNEVKQLLDDYSKQVSENERISAELREELEKEQKKTQRLKKLSNLQEFRNYHGGSN